MNIGQAAQASGLSAKTIRYYEINGLLPAASRSRAGYRVYDEKEVHTLRFIHRARQLGFSMQDIRQLLTLWQDRDRASADVKALALAHASVLDRKLADVQAMLRTLRHLIAYCEGDNRPECPILDDLAGESTELPIRDIRPSLH
ncbi:MAG: Cu(I)-responsive transcriptional regulator [Ensifer adhaerens]